MAASQPMLLCQLPHCLHHHWLHFFCCCLCLHVLVGASQNVPQTVSCNKASSMRQGTALQICLLAHPRRTHKCLLLQYQILHHRWSEGDRASTHDPDPAKGSRSQTHSMQNGRPPRCLHQSPQNCHGLPFLWTAKDWQPSALHHWCRSHHQLLACQVHLQSRSADVCNWSRFLTPSMIKKCVWNFHHFVSICKSSLGLCVNRPHSHAGAKLTNWPTEGFSQSAMFAWHCGPASIGVSRGHMGKPSAHFLSHVKCAFIFSSAILDSNSNFHTLPLSCMAVKKMWNRVSTFWTCFCTFYCTVQGTTPISTPCQKQAPWGPFCKLQLGFLQTAQCSPAASSNKWGQLLCCFLCSFLNWNWNSQIDSIIGCCHTAVVLMMPGEMPDHTGALPPPGPGCHTAVLSTMAISHALVVWQKILQSDKHRQSKKNQKSQKKEKPKKPKEKPKRKMGPEFTVWHTADLPQWCHSATPHPESSLTNALFSQQKTLMQRKTTALVLLIKEENGETVHQPWVHNLKFLSLPTHLCALSHSGRLLHQTLWPARHTQCHCEVLQQTGNVHQFGTVK